MRKRSLLSLPASIFAVAFIISCNAPEAKTEETSVAISNDSLVKRGSYLVTVMGCDDCHSPKKMGPMGPEIIPELRLSGYPSNRQLGKIDQNVVKNGWLVFAGDLTAAAGPWGVSFAANITSDSTGIGAWTETQFKKAIKEGKFKGLDNSRSILPPMPWTNFKNLNDEDIQSIFAYLKTVKPVKNAVPEPIAPGGK